MDAVTKWVPWVPQGGDKRPDVYQWREKGWNDWHDGTHFGETVDECDAISNEYRVPDRPRLLDIDLPYLLRKSAACSPSTQAAVLVLKAKFADDVGRLIEADTKGGAV